MEKYYPTYLFIEVIEGVKGITYKTQKIKDDVIMRFYIGLLGTTVMIDCSDEDISYTICKDYLIQLGLKDLSKSIFI